MFFNKQNESTFSGVDDLKDARNFLGIGTDDVALSDGADVKDFVQVEDEDGIGVLLVALGIVEEDLLGRHDHVLLPPSVTSDVLFRRNRQPPF